MNKEVSFPIAKLLKEKGFDMPCNDYYTSRGLLNSDGWGDIIYEDGGFSSGEPERMIKFDYSDFSKRQKEEYYLCPTIAEVVMWLYEKHGIWIEATMGKDHTGIWFDWDIFSTILPRKDDELGEEDVEYEDDPNEKWLNYDTTYSSMIDERFATFDKKSHSSPTEAYEAAILYTLNNLI